MAEVILPPEELEPELPEEQLPEVEKPTEKSKVISVDFNPLNTKQTTSLDTRESFFTTDTDAWIVLNVGDMNEPTGQYSLALINKEDGSIFQRVGDIVKGVAYYKLIPDEIKHAGRWVGQAVITLANGQTTASRFSFNVSGHILDGKDVREIVIQDFQTLMAQLSDLKDSAGIDIEVLKNNVEEINRVAQEKELERSKNETARVEAEAVRQDSYENKVNTALAGVDIDKRVGDKVIELTPTINKVVADLGTFEQSTTAQFQQTAKQSFVDAQFASIVSGAPQGTFTDLVSLKAAHPNGAEGVFLVLENGNWYYWNEDSVSWLSGGVYQATASDEFVAENIIKNGGFSSDAEGWRNANSISNVVGSSLVFTATVANGHIRQAVRLLKNRKYYIQLSLKANSENVGVVVENSVSPYTVVLPKTYHSGRGSTEVMGKTFDVGTTGDYHVKISDWSVSGWLPVTVDSVLIIDLTEVFGYGKEPKADRMEEIINKYHNGWFDGKAAMLNKRNFYEAITENKYFFNNVMAVENENWGVN